MQFDPAAETKKYIDSLGPETLEKAANYTIGSHWIMLWSLLVLIAVTWIINKSGILHRLSVRLEKRGWFTRTWVMCSAYFLIASLLSLPWTIYQGWSREASYGRTKQPLSDFLMQDAIGTGLNVVLGGLFFVGVYALMRKLGARWWLWSGLFTAAVGGLMLLLSPTLIEPLFNDYKPVPEGPVRAELLKMAGQAKIPHDRIFMFDGSRQSENFTANVSGVLGSARIAISDVALKKASLDEVKAVTGHEIGHYVLSHVWRSVFLSVALAMLGFFLANRLFPTFARLLGSSATIAEPSGLPILILIISLFSLLVQPVLNAFIRQGEREADNYSLKTVNLPDALAGALVKTAEYRNPRPSALQEALFYTHPSVEWRVRNAMEWKAKQLGGATQQSIK